MRTSVLYFLGLSTKTTGYRILPSAIGYTDGRKNHILVYRRQGWGQY